MRTFNIWSISLLILLPFTGTGQIIFPGESGNALLDHLRMDYSPSSVLSLAHAKDTLYSSIDNVDGRVYTIYCGHSLDLPSGVDPSVWLFDGRGAEAINLEHVYPRSKGAEEGSQAHSDMHHLYPSRESVNSDRASFPFAEIDDNQTDKWYLFTDVMTNPPSTDRDLYSEFVNGRFEPRESKKGDIARAIFYFYTIYEDRALTSDPDYFESMRTTLCTWHIADEADEAEKLRSQKIAIHQGNENPFAVDCSLATRSYCADMGFLCNPVATNELLTKIDDINAFIDIEDNLILNWTSINSGQLNFNLFNSAGQLIHSETGHPVTSGSNNISKNVSAISSGIYYVQLHQSTSSGLAYWSGPVFISH